MVKRDRNSYEGWTNQGLALEKLGERKQAFAAFAKAVSINAAYKPATEGMRRTQSGSAASTPARRAGRGRLRKASAERQPSPRYLHRRGRR